jgi:hypothetical protein
MTLIQVSEDGVSAGEQRGGEGQTLDQQDILLEGKVREGERENMRIS